MFLKKKTIHELERPQKGWIQTTGEATVADQLSEQGIKNFELVSKYRGTALNLKTETFF